jgi:hypothetical protein
MIFISSAYSFFDLIPCNYQSLLPMFGWLSVKDLMAPEEDQLREPAEHKNVSGKHTCTRDIDFGRATWAPMT